MIWALAPYCRDEDGKQTRRPSYKQRRRGWQGRVHFGPLHMPYSKVKGFIPENYFSFAFVRNPFEAAYSSWARNHESGLKDRVPDTFKEYIKQVLTRKSRSVHGRWTQWAYLSDGDQIGVDFLGRFENLKKDWETVTDLLGLKDIFLPKMNQNETRDTSVYREFYTPKMVEMMSRRYAKDLEEFGYEF
jgi:hypothetical protein